MIRESLAVMRDQVSFSENFFEWICDKETKKEGVTKQVALILGLVVLLLNKLNNEELIGIYWKPANITSLKKTYNANPDLMDAVISVVSLDDDESTLSPIPIYIRAFLWYVFGKIDPKLRDDFFIRLLASKGEAEEVCPPLEYKYWKFIEKLSETGVKKGKHNMIWRCYLISSIKLWNLMYYGIEDGNVTSVQSSRIPKINGIQFSGLA